MREERRCDHLYWQAGDVVVPEVESPHTGDALQVLRGHYRDPGGEAAEPNKKAILSQQWSIAETD